MATPAAAIAATPAKSFCRWTPEDFCAFHGIQLGFLPPGAKHRGEFFPPLPGVGATGTARIALRPGLTGTVRDWVFWHEVGHWFDLAIATDVRGMFRRGWDLQCGPRERELLHAKKLLMLFKDVGSRDVAPVLACYPLKLRLLAQQREGKRCGERTCLPRPFRALYNYRSTRWELWAEAVACAMVSPCVMAIHAPELLDSISRLFAETEAAQRARFERAA